MPVRRLIEWDCPDCGAVHQAEADPDAADRITCSNCARAFSRTSLLEDDDGVPEPEPPVVIVAPELVPGDPVTAAVQRATDPAFRDQVRLLLIGTAHEIAADGAQSFARQQWAATILGCSSIEFDTYLDRVAWGVSAQHLDDPLTELRDRVRGMVDALVPPLAQAGDIGG